MFKNIMLTISAFALITGCREPETNNDMARYIVEESRTISKESEIYTDIDQEKYKIIYPIQEYKRFFPIHERCQELASVDTKLAKIMRYMAMDEVLSIASPNLYGMFESGLKNTNLLAISPYLTGSILYFASPSEMTTKTANEHVKKIKNTVEYKEIKEIIADYVSRIQKNKKQDSSDEYNIAKSTIVCISVDAFLGYVGKDSYLKRSADALADIFPGQNLRGLKKSLFEN